MSKLPFVEEILADLRRFKECAEDNQDVDLERDRFDLLTQLGLLERTQRSPALWVMTQAGEDAIAQPAADEPVAWARQCDLDESDPAIFVAREEVRESGYVIPLFRIATPVAAGEPKGWRLVPIEPLLGMMSDKDHETRINSERTLLAMLDKAPPAAAHGDEVVRKDAARYQWLRSKSSGLALTVVANHSGTDLDSEIDAAIRAQVDGGIGDA